jgi:hypothetical protein
MGTGVRGVHMVNVLKIVVGEESFVPVIVIIHLLQMVEQVVMERIENKHGAGSAIALLLAFHQMRSLEMKKD